MRKIEEQMVKAIKEQRDWKSDNTRVSHTSNGLSFVYLYGHMIAKLSGNTLRVTLAGHNTATTRSRLTALCREFAPGCYGIGTKKGFIEIRYGSGRNVIIENDEWAVI